MDRSDPDANWTRPLGPGRLRINGAGRTHCLATWRWEPDPRTFRDYDLWVVLAGRGRMRTPDGEHALTPGACFILRGGEHYLGTTDPQDRLVVSHTHFDLLDVRGRPDRRAPPPRYRQLEDLPTFDGLLRRLFAVHLQEDDGGEARLWLAAALTEVLRQDQRRCEVQDVHGAAIDELCAELVADPGDRRSIAALAVRLGCGPDHFTRLFRARTGLSPQEYRIRVRLEQAAELLRTSGQSVAAIAAQVGYVDPYFFSRQFRARMGVNPSAWRRADSRPAPRPSRA